MATCLCSSGNGSVSSSPPSAATFYNMEVAWFCLTTFFPLSGHLCLFQNLYCENTDSICDSALGEKMSESRPIFFLSLALNSSFLSFLSEKAKNYYFKDCPPTCPWQVQYESNWNHKHLKRLIRLRKARVVCTLKTLQLASDSFL